MGTPGRHEAALPALLVLAGGAGGLGGWLALRDRTADPGCTVREFVDVYVRAVSSEYSCDQAARSMVLILALLAAGTLVAMTGLLFGLRRSRRAAAEGSPWPARKRLQRWAVSLDRRLPGFHEDLPRIATWVLTVPLVLVLTGIAAGGTVLWQAHEDHQREARHHVAQRALAQLALPATMRRLAPSPDHGCLAGHDVLCAESDLLPSQLLPDLLSLLHARSTIGYGGQAQARAVSGTVAGYPAEATLVRRLVRIDRSSPRPRAVFGGTDVVIYLVDPP